jgi:hypothetical protein
MHSIEDELVFKTHKRYIFHDSCGFECGSQDELKIVQDFVRRKSGESRLKDRLHAIWFVHLRIYSCKFTGLVFRYCIPMDDDRPEQNSKHFDKICPDENGVSTCSFINWD